jgi:hypothetical protein
MAILIQLAIRPSALWAHQPVISWVRTSRRLSPPIHLVMRDSEGRSFKYCADSTAPIILRSRSCPTSSTDKLATTREIFDRIGRAVSPPYHRLKKKMVKAEFISASIGPLIRLRESRLVVAWAITCSITLSGRRTRNLEVNRLVWAAGVKQL